jgi:hypothetical protein
VLAAAAAGELASSKDLGLLQQLQGVTYSMRFARLPNEADIQQPWQGSTPGDTQPIAPSDDMLHLFHKLVRYEAWCVFHNVCIIGSWAVGDCCAVAPCAAVCEEAILQRINRRMCARTLALVCRFLDQASLCSSASLTYVGCLHPVRFQRCVAVPYALLPVVCAGTAATAAEHNLHGTRGAAS